MSAARDRGLGPGNFALHTVNVGGELMTAALADAARETLGVRRINDTYGATELMPFGGQSCEEGHLHLDPNLGYVEVLDLSTGEPAGPGELGTLVVTPYLPGWTRSARSRWGFRTTSWPARTSATTAAGH